MGEPSQGVDMIGNVISGMGKLTVSSKMKPFSPVRTNSSVPGDPSVRHKTSPVRTISPLRNIPAIRELPSVNSYPPASIVGRCWCHLDPFRVRHIFQILSIIFAPRMERGKKQGLLNHHDKALYHIRLFGPNQSVSLY